MYHRVRCVRLSIVQLSFLVVEFYHVHMQLVQLRLSSTGIHDAVMCCMQLDLC